MVIFSINKEKFSIKVNGIARPNEVLAIMGASGAGKLSI